MTKKWQKNIDKLPSNIRNKIQELVNNIKNWNLDWLDIQTLSWVENWFRCRKWDLRIIYEIINWEITIKGLDNRWDVYKKHFSDLFK